MEAVNESVPAESCSMTIKELLTCINIVRSVNGLLVLPSNHHVYTRLSLTLVGGEDAEIAHALHLLSLLAQCPENCLSCLQALTDSGSQVENYLAFHNKIDGSRSTADDDIHCHSLALLMRVSDYKFTGTQLLDLYDGALALALASLSVLLKKIFWSSSVDEQFSREDESWTRDVKLTVCLTRSLYELSTADTYFSRLCGPTDLPMADMQKGFLIFIVELIKSTLRLPILQTLSGILDSWFELIESAENVASIEILPSFRTALCNTLLFVTNLLTLTSKYSALFKVHLAQQTVLIQNVVLPFILYELDSVNQTLDHEALIQGMQALCLSLKAVSLVSYKIRNFRPWFKKFPLLGARMIQTTAIWNSDFRVEFFALVVRLAVNCELEDSVPAILAQHEQLPSSQKLQLASRLSNPRELMYPVNVFSHIYQQLREVFQFSASAPIMAEVPSPPTFMFRFSVKEENKDFSRQTKYRRRGRKSGLRREAQKKRYSKLRRREHKHATQHNLAPEDESDEEVEDDEWEDIDENANDGQQTLEAQPILDIKARELAIRALREREKAEGEMVEMSDFSVKRVFPRNEEMPQPLAPPKQVEVLTPSAEEAEVEELPVPASGLDLSPWRRPPPPGVPSQYLCALSQQLITVPVISPSGDVYDKATILDFLKVHKHTCPLTGGELYQTDLVVDKTLQREIDAVRYNYSWQ